MHENCWPTPQVRKVAGLSQPGVSEGDEKKKSETQKNALGGFELLSAGFQTQGTY